MLKLEDVLSLFCYPKVAPKKLVNAALSTKSFAEIKEARNLHKQKVTKKQKDKFLEVCLADNETELPS